MLNQKIFQLDQDVEVLRGGEVLPTRAFFQSITRQREQEQQRRPTPLGLRREDRYLYLGLPQVEVKAGESRVRWQGQEYEVQSAHPIYVGNKPSHWWAVLTPADKEAV